MSFNTVDYQGKDTGPGLSRSLWGGTGFNAEERDKYAFIMDDFYSFVDVGASSSESMGRGINYYAATTTGQSAETKTGNGTGVLTLLNVDDSDAAISVSLADDAHLGQMVATKGSNKKRWWETRVRLSATTLQSLFVGLRSPGDAAETDLADAGTGIYQLTHVGFTILEATPTRVDAVYGTTTTASTALLTDVGTIVADTWMKLGLYFDGTYCRYFVDGTEVTKVAVTATNFPDSLDLGLGFAICPHESDDKELDIDWWAFGAER
jgi:hypothetical protein